MDQRMASPTLAAHRSRRQTSARLAKCSSEKREEAELHLTAWHVRRIAADADRVGFDDEVSLVVIRRCERDELDVVAFALCAARSLFDPGVENMGYSCCAAYAWFSR
jgi:hypothetical protein